MENGRLRGYWGGGLQFGLLRLVGSVKSGPESFKASCGMGVNQCWG